MLEGVALQVHAGDGGADPDHHQDHHQHAGGQHSHGAGGGCQACPQPPPRCGDPARAALAGRGHGTARYRSTGAACAELTLTGPVVPSTGPRPGTGTGMLTSAVTVPPGVTQGSSLQLTRTTSWAPSPKSARTMWAWSRARAWARSGSASVAWMRALSRAMMSAANTADCTDRSEEHTSELQSRGHLVCRLLLENKKM